MSITNTVNSKQLERKVMSKKEKNDESNKNSPRRSTRKRKSKLQRYPEGENNIINDNKWEDNELESFYISFQENPKNWSTISEQVKTKNQDECKNLFEIHESFLESDSNSLKGFLSSHKDLEKILGKQ
jgi:hypothetical protein